MKYFICIGSRPEIIKMSPVIRALQERRSEFFIYHTGQHYDYEMAESFYKEFDLKIDRFRERPESLGDMYNEIRKSIIETNPMAVLVYGDTNSVLMGALAGFHQRKPVVHIEAGLRSGDLKMFEELNRVMVDHIGTFLFAPTEVSRGNLLEEGIDYDRIHVVGNTIVDVVTDVSRGMRPSDDHIYVTMHRAETIHDKQKVDLVLQGISLVQEYLGLPVVFPIHPHTKKCFDEFGIDLTKRIDKLEVIKPTSFAQSIDLQMRSKVVMTDSGGLQEEACILGKPCITFRENTERPESVEVGANKICGFSPEAMVDAVEEFQFSNFDWKQPFGEYGVGLRIAQILDRSL